MNYKTALELNTHTRPSISFGPLLQFRKQSQKTITTPLKEEVLIILNRGYSDFRLPIPSLMFLSILKMINDAFKEIVTTTIETYATNQISWDDVISYRRITGCVVLCNFEKQLCGIIPLENMTKIRETVTLKEVIRTQAINYQGVVFGGDIRDIIEGFYLTLNDIDIDFKNHKKAIEFMDALEENNGCKTYVISDSNIYGLEARVYKIIVSKGSAYVSVDIVITTHNYNPISRKSPYFKHYFRILDFDVNSFYLSPLTGNICNAKHNKRFLVQKILNRTMSAVTCYWDPEYDYKTHRCISYTHMKTLEYRHTKMKAKGYSLTPHICNVISCVHCCPMVLKKHKIKQKINTRSHVNESRNTRYHIKVLRKQAYWDYEVTPKAISETIYERRSKYKL